MTDIKADSIVMKNAAGSSTFKTISATGETRSIMDIFDEALADHTARGVIRSATVDTNSVGLFSALFLASDGHYDEADADALASMPCSALALETGTGTKRVLVWGIARDDTWNWTVGGRLYVSGTVGTLTQTAPAGEDDCVQCVGVALTADIIFFAPSFDVAVVTAS
jgi:hypothetical protein